MGASADRGHGGDAGGARTPPAPVLHGAAAHDVDRAPQDQGPQQGPQPAEQRDPAPRAPGCGCVARQMA